MGLAMVVCLVAPPLAGTYWSGHAVAPYLRFPPLTVPVRPAGFSWPAFTLLAAFITMLLAGLLVDWLRHAPPAGHGPRNRHGFPWWGWLGAGLLCLTWFFAWTRFDWFTPLQRHTFTPLWAGYIVIINALTWRRSGRSLLTHQPAYLLLLFPLSAIFWWFFEYLNRFVNNWHYIGTETFSGIEYVTFASISFSTVLPATMSTLDWLQSHSRLVKVFPGAGVPILADRRWPYALFLTAAIVTGSLLGSCPDILFPMVWVAPLFVVAGIQGLAGQPNVLAPLLQGQWRPLVLPALAGLVCGFFWELWNWHSLAHWEYSVPYVDRFQVFEMPLLGFAGYLPFGVECVVAASLVTRR